MFFLPACLKGESPGGRSVAALGNGNGNVTVTFAYGRRLYGPREAGRRSARGLMQTFYATLLCRSDAMPCHDSIVQRATVPMITITLIILIFVFSFPPTGIAAQ